MTTQLSTLRRPCTTLLRILAAWALLVGGVPHAGAVGVDFVHVGDAGNAADTTGYGAVGYAYEIGKFEVTNAQYVQFLNAVDPEGTNPNAIYNASMGSDARGGISFISGNAAGSKYASRTNMADKPVNWVSWFDGARVANWLENGALTYATTASGSSAINSGAYTLNGATSGNTVSKNPGATYWVPSENDWYKAAYYKGGGTNAGYWTYATQSNVTPTAVNASTIGSGTYGGASPVTSGNYANFNLSGDWNALDGNVTSVGTNGGPSAYGTYDMNGNVHEINGLDGSASSFQGFRGGGWATVPYNLVVSSSAAPSADNNTIGFRIASIVPTSLSWNTTSGTWNSSTLNWSNGKGGNYALATSSSATFSNTAGGTVTISGTVRPSGITVSASSGTYALNASSGNTITGTAALLKQGTGTLTLSGSHGYSGPTTVQAGTLALSGTLAASAVTVQAGATLAGNAFLGSSLTVLASGTLSPGTSPGTVTAATVTLAAGSTTLMEIVGSAGAGNDYDTIVVTGSNALAYGGTLALVLSNTATFATGTTFDLFQFTGATPGDFAAITLSAPGGSPYANLSFTPNPDGSWYSGDTPGNQYLKFSPLTGDLVVVPEPSTWVAALAGIALAAALARRRRP